MEEMNTTNQTEGESEAPKNIVSVIKSILKKQSSGVAKGEENALANVQVSQVGVSLVQTDGLKTVVT